MAPEIYTFESIYRHYKSHPGMSSSAAPDDFVRLYEDRARLLDFIGAMLKETGDPRCEQALAEAGE